MDRFLKNSHYKEVLLYFSKKAKNYDLVDTQLYWRLSDKLLWYALREVLLKKIKEKKVSLLDAGAGTGRWSIKMVQYLKEAKIYLVDASREMLEVAKEKVKNKQSRNRMKFYNIFLEELDKIFPKNFFYATINLHNVLGFVKDPVIVMEKLSLVTKRIVISFVPNLYHMIYFNIKTGNINEALYAAFYKKGRFTKDMPRIHAFTPESIRDIYEKAGIKKVKIYGFPKFLYPGEEETKIVGNTKELKNILQDKRNFKKIFSLEKKFIFDESACSRGNMLFVVGKK